MINRIILALLLVVVWATLCAAQGTQGVAYRIRGGTSAPPATCRATAPVDVYYKSDTDQLYVCTAANTWTLLATAGGGFSCAACANNKLQKGNGAGNLADSRITDNGTDITLENHTGATKLGDYGDVVNGTFLILDDPAKSLQLRADDSGTTSSLDMIGGATPSVSLVSGAGQQLSFPAGGDVTLFALGSAYSLQLQPGSNFSRLNANGVALTVDNSASAVTITANLLQPAANATTDLGTTSLGYKQAFFDATITAGGTTGAQTINKSAGSVNFAAAATSLVVTSNKVTANSIVMCTVATNDTTLKSVQCVAASGSFTMFGNAAATAETRVNFWILNQ